MSVIDKLFEQYQYTIVQFADGMYGVRRRLRWLPWTRGEFFGDADWWFTNQYVYKHCRVGSLTRAMNLLADAKGHDERLYQAKLAERVKANCTRRFIRTINPEQVDPIELAQEKLNGRA
jgi:hypothetical protein